MPECYATYTTQPIQSMPGCRALVHHLWRIRAISSRPFQPVGPSHDREWIRCWALAPNLTRDIRSDVCIHVPGLFARLAKRRSGRWGLSVKVHVYIGMIIMRSFFIGNWFKRDGYLKLGRYTKYMDWLFFLYSHHRSKTPSVARFF